MKFTKMQGIGNDYVYVNCLQETIEIHRNWQRRSVIGITESVRTGLL